jgi:hypothetical protein
MKIPIVWTIHNLKPHIIFNPGFQARLYQRFADSADGVIHHSRCGMRTVLKSYNFRESTKHAMIRHGYFTKDTECDLSRGAAREKIVLPPEKHIYLYCGAFRRDKNIDILTCAFGEAGADPSHMLVMVGDDREAAAALYPDCNVDSPNILWPGRLSFQELSIYARAADALISAHGDKHLTSAGPHLSQTYLKPLICPSSDYNHEVLGENGFYFEGGTKAPENLRCLLDGITPEILQSTAGSIERQRVEYQWSEIGKKTKVLYEELLHGD